MSALVWYTGASAGSGVGGTVTTANVYDKRFAKLTFDNNDVRAIYIDWDDGEDNSKLNANYQWIQFDYPVSSAIIEHTYTQTGAFKPVIQTVNSSGIFSKYFQNASSNSTIAPFEEASTIATMTVSDKAATSTINLENKQVLSGIDNSYFDKYGPMDIYLTVPPILAVSEVPSMAPMLDVEMEVVYGLVSGSEGPDAGGSEAVITKSFTGSATIDAGSGVEKINDDAYKVKRIVKVKYVNSKSDDDTYTQLDNFNKLKLFIVTSGATLTAGGGNLVPYYPITYVSDGSPVKRAEDATRIVNFDMAQSRTAASNTSLTNYRYDNGKNWFNPVDVWNSDTTKLTDVSGSSAGNYQASYTYSPRPDGLMQKGGNTDASGDYVLALGSGSNYKWIKGTDQEPRTDQFILDEYNRFVSQGHLLRTWVSGNGGQGSTIDTYKGIFRISPALNWDATAAQSQVGSVSQSICRNYEDMGATTPDYTIDTTVAAYNNVSGNSGQIDLDAVNTLDYEDREGNDRIAYEYLLLIADKKHNKIFVQASPYAKDLMTNASGGTNQTEIAGLYYLHAENNKSSLANIYWKPLKFEDKTKSTVEYRNTTADTYSTTGASFSKSGFIEFNEPLDWSAVSFFDLMGQPSGYSGWGTKENTAIPTTPTPNDFEFQITATCSATGATTQGKQATFVKTAGTIPTALSGNTEGIGAYKYLCIVSSGSATSGPGAVGTGSAYWVADGFGDGYDGTNTFKVQIGNETFWGGGGPSIYGNFATSSVTYVLHFRRINWYDVIDGASKVWSSNPTGAAANAFVLNNVDSKDGDSWLNYFSFISGSAAGAAMNSKWGNNDYYVLKMVLKGNKYQSGSTSSSPATGSGAGVVGPEVWNILPYDNSFSQFVEEIDDHAYSLNSIPLTSDISVGRKGNFYQAITRKGKVYIAKTGIGIEKISFSSVALGDEGDSKSDKFDEHGPGTLYGYLRKVRNLQADSVRVYWDEQQKDGTYIRFWGIITDVTDTRGASGPRSVVNYTFNMTVEEIAIYDGNKNLITDIYPLGGIEDVRTYS